MNHFREGKTAFRESKFSLTRNLSFLVVIDDVIVLTISSFVKISFICCYGNEKSSAIGIYIVKFGLIYLAFALFAAFHINV